VFVGREMELDSLNKSFDKGTFQFPVIYGRRRVGKISFFCFEKYYLLVVI